MTQPMRLKVIVMIEMRTFTKLDKQRRNGMNLNGIHRCYAKVGMFASSLSASLPYGTLGGAFFFLA